MPLETNGKPMKTYENDELAYLRKVFGAASNLLFAKARPQFMAGDAAEQELRDAVNEAQEFYDNTPDMP